MRFIKHLAAAVAAVILFSQCLWPPSDEMADLTKQFGPDSRIVAVVNTDVEARLQVGGKDPVPISGTLSLHAETSVKRLAGQDIAIKGFNLVFYGVDQNLFGGADSAVKSAPLSLYTPADVNAITKYDPVGKKYNLTIPVKAHYARLDEYNDPDIKDKKTDYTVPRTLDGKISFDIRLIFDKNNPRSISLETTKSLAVVPPFERPDSPGFTISVKEAIVSAQLGNSETVVTKTLCVQPVNITGVGWMPETGRGAGKGYEIGWNGVLEQWSNKGGIEFDVRPDWITIPDADLRVLQNVEEANVLRGMVNVDHCISMIFVHEYKVPGGGDTTPIGVETSKIVTSDAIGANNATHLAHEMGHVLGLPDSSFFTLMCASGDKDNPDFNSWENILAARNVLITFSINSVTDGPLRTVAANCNLSVECGQCPYSSASNSNSAAR